MATRTGVNGQLDWSIIFLYLKLSFTIIRIMPRCANPYYFLPAICYTCWIGLFLFLSCTDADPTALGQPIDLPPSRTAQGVLQAVVETPMGSFIPQGYNSETKQIESIQSASATMLPYICHSGFIPIKEQDQISVWITGKQVKTGKILGFHIIGPYAPILIQEVINAMALGGQIGFIGQGMHIHPALPELILRTFGNLREV